ncbi:MAG TPA: DUF2268 domain-containing putative Zn-dependent protease [Candidatus Angelobacter sp.]|jgi:hypothetical protein|nr:DUF2268 domain-containing putative Zn-dependent protease [Candidatus Angelobacter sp.]
MRLVVFFSLFLCPSIYSRPQGAAGPLQNHDPEKAIITADDVSLFWKAYDHWAGDLKADPAKLAEVLQQEYLDKGSQGVKDFTPGRIVSARHLSDQVLKYRAYYEGVRHNTELIQSAIPEIRKNFGEMKRLYPDAVFPPVYFLIGAINSGGTSSGHGLMIGAEMFSEKNPLAPSTDSIAIVMHELMHFQQKHADDTLLATCLREGSADFVAELASGHNLNARNKTYGDSHEEELWRKLQEDIKKPKNEHLHDWLYNYDEAKRVGPPDLGYYMGYKIAQAYYQSARDKAAALKAIIEMRDPEKILANSGYGKRFSNQDVK